MYICLVYIPLLFMRAQQNFRQLLCIRLQKFLEYYMSLPNTGFP